MGDLRGQKPSTLDSLGEVKAQIHPEARSGLIVTATGTRFGGLLDRIGTPNAVHDEWAQLDPIREEAKPDRDTHSKREESVLPDFRSGQSEIKPKKRKHHFIKPLRLRSEFGDLRLIVFPLTEPLFENLEILGAIRAGTCYRPCDSTKDAIACLRDSRRAKYSDGPAPMPTM